MEETRKDRDLETIRDREAFIRSQLEFLSDQRAHQDQWIIWARESGATYVELGAALGVTWQAAEQRHKKALKKNATQHDSPVAGP